MKREEQLDLILEYLDKTGSYFIVEQIFNKNNLSIESKEAGILAELLINDGYVDHKIISGGRKLLKINIKGSEFIKSSGYKIQNIKSLEKQKNTEIKEKLEIETMKSTIKSEKWNKISIVINIILTVINIGLAILIATGVIRSLK